MKRSRFLPLFGVALSLLVVLGTARQSAAALASETPAQAPSPITASSSLPLEEARVIIDAAVAYARNLKLRMTVAVLDDGGHLISADRMDGASFNGERTATGKAFTAVMTRRPSAAAAELSKTAPERYYGIMNMYPGQVYLVPGGLPLTVNNRIVGAVGVSGLPSGMDEKACEAGIAAWQKYREAAKK